MKSWLTARIIIIIVINRTSVGGEVLESQLLCLNGFTKKQKKTNAELLSSVVFWRFNSATEEIQGFFSFSFSHDQQVGGFYSQGR